MAHFTVAHLPFRQAHILAVGNQGRLRMIRHEAVEAGGLGHVDGIVLVGGTEAPAVEDNEGSLIVHCGVKLARASPRQPHGGHLCQQGGGNPQ